MSARYKAQKQARISSGSLCSKKIIQKNPAVWQPMWR